LLSVAGLAWGLTPSRVGNSIQRVATRCQVHEEAQARFAQCRENVHSEGRLALSLAGVGVCLGPLTTPRPLPAARRALGAGGSRAAGGAMPARRRGGRTFRGAWRGRSVLRRGAERRR